MLVCYSVCMRAVIKRGVEFWWRFERHLSVGALAMGFIFDLIIADRPDSIPNNILLLSYLIIAGALIIFLNIRQAKREESTAPLLLLLVLQFAFGGLASNLLVLYGRSGTLAGSAIFIAILVAMLVGNEFLRNRYAFLRFNVGVYYLLLLTYCVMAVPVFLTHTIGLWVFLLSGVISIALIGGFLTLLFYTVFRGRDTKALGGVVRVVVGIFVAFNLLYLTNVIPPVPLSLEGIGIYHSVLKRSDESYLALFEKPPWWQFWRDTASIYTIDEAKSAFCFSSVFAPTELKAPVVHVWEYYSGEGWQEQARVSFPISGGAESGYRGYSVTSRLRAGKWRCSVETAQGALIGRVGFEVVSDGKPELSQKIL